MNSIAYLLDGAVVANDECLAEVGLDTLAFGVDSHQPQLLPTSLYDFLDAKIELATHDDGVRFFGELVEEVETDAVDLVVDVKAFDVSSVALHDDIDELVDGCCRALADIRVL